MSWGSHFFLSAQHAACAPDEQSDGCAYHSAEDYPWQVNLPRWIEAQFVSASTDFAFCQGVAFEGRALELACGGDSQHGVVQLAVAVVHWDDKFVDVALLLQHDVHLVLQCYAVLFIVGISWCGDEQCDASVHGLFGHTHIIAYHFLLVDMDVGVGDFSALIVGDVEHGALHAYQTFGRRELQCLRIPIVLSGYEGLGYGAITLLAPKDLDRLSLHHLDWTIEGHVFVLHQEVELESIHRRQGLYGTDALGFEIEHEVRADPDVQCLIYEEDTSAMAILLLNDGIAHQFVQIVVAAIISDGKWCIALGNEAAGGR